MTAHVEVHFKSDLISEEATLYDASNIEKLPWDQFEHGHEAKKHLYSLVTEGTEPYFSNVKTRVYVVTSGKLLFPITVNEKEYGNSYVASNYYVVAMLDEWLSKKNVALRMLGKPFKMGLSAFMKGIKINRMVMLNNWLFPNNIPPQATAKEIERAIDLIKRHFPKHLFMWRNLETFHGMGLVDTLKQLKFHTLKTRSIFFYDPGKKDHFSPKVHYHHRRDLKLVEKEGYELIRTKDIQEGDIPRLLELYKKIYIDKHTSFSPGFTTHFLKKALREETMDFLGIRKNGQIDGIIGMYKKGKVMISPFFGYDNTLPSATSLYRMLTVLLLKEAELKGVVLNDSSGGAATKKYRGLKSYLEYAAIYDRHLSLGRRLYWTLMEKIVNRVIYPLTSKME